MRLGHLNPADVRFLVHGRFAHDGVIYQSRGLLGALAPLESLGAGGTLSGAPTGPSVSGGSWRRLGTS